MKRPKPKQWAIAGFIFLLFLVFSRPTISPVRQVVTLSTIMGFTFIILSALTFWPAVRIKLARGVANLHIKSLTFRYKIFRRRTALIALTSLLILFVQRLGLRLLLFTGRLNSPNGVVAGPSIIAFPRRGPNISSGNSANHEFPGSRGVESDIEAYRKEGLGYSIEADRLRTRALNYALSSRYEDARKLLEKAVAMQESSKEKNQLQLAWTLDSLASVYTNEGRYADAEELMGRAIALRERALGPNDIEVAGGLASLAALYVAEGRYPEAEALLQRAIAVFEKTSGKSDPVLGPLLTSLAEVQGKLGRYLSAELLLRRALAIDEKNPPLKVQEARASRDLAAIYESQKHYAQAEPLLNRALLVDSLILGFNPQLFSDYNDLAMLYEQEGRYADAEPLIEKAIARYNRFGFQDASLPQLLNNAAKTYADEGKISLARERYERAREISIGLAEKNHDLADETLAALVNGSKGYLPQYLLLLSRIIRTPELDPGIEPLKAEQLAFVVAEEARGGIAQAALAKAAIRSAAGDPALSDIARQEQDLANQQTAVKRALDAEYAKPEDQQVPARVNSLQQTSAKIEERLAIVSAQLGKACAKCREVSSFEPISIADTRKLLSAGEGMLSLFVVGDRVMAWLVRSDANFKYLDLPLNIDLNLSVGRLRRSLSFDDPYDVVDAYALYQLLIEPFSEDLAGIKHLIIVPDEILLPIPFSALVTNNQSNAFSMLADEFSKGLQPAPIELRTQYPLIAWLARGEFTLSELPTATSLRLLRTISSSSAAEANRGPAEPFIGIGDPLLDGRGKERGGAMVSIGRGGEVNQIQRLPRLPGAKAELEAEARALGADPKSALFTAERATKPEVMLLNRQERLGNARVVGFATHALTGGQIKGLAEPALVLTPPKEQSPEDNGLLALGDVMRLQLKRTNLVLLSACNTAAPGGSGEGFSGLTRAFFYAGTRSLLVSQWSVDDAATERLMTAVLATYAAQKGVSDAQALRLGMRKMMTDEADGNHAYFAHPFAWAPFMVVGEGGPSKK